MRHLQRIFWQVDDQERQVVSMPVSTALMMLLASFHLMFSPFDHKRPIRRDCLCSRMDFLVRGFPVVPMELNAVLMGVMRALLSHKMQVQAVASQTTRASLAVPSVLPSGTWAWLTRSLTGFVVEDEISAVAAVGRLADLSRPAIRKQFETRFTARRMALDYLAAYRGLMEAAEPRLKLVSSAE